MGNKFEANQKWATDFNNGNKYKKNDGVQASTINNLIEGVLYVQGLAFGDIEPIIQTGVQDVQVNGESVLSYDGKVANISIEKPYEKEISINDGRWKQPVNTTKWQITIPQVDHGFNKITRIVAERITEIGTHENMVYSYKRYSSGNVAIITDYKIDMYIIIKGTK